MNLGRAKNLRCNDCFAKHLQLASIQPLKINTHSLIPCTHIERMQPTARQHDADLREQMRSKNMQKYDFDTAARHFSQKNNQQSPGGLWRRTSTNIDEL